jgi:hypothetical protein
VKKIIIIAIMVFLILLTLFFYSFYKAPEKKKAEVIEEKDERISPLTNQGLTVEILRIRHRGLLDKILKFGISWRKKPTFYWKIIVDGKETNSFGTIGLTGVYEEWDTKLWKGRANYFIEEEEEESSVIIIIVEREGRKDIEKEKIQLLYDYRTGRWSGDDYFKDEDGYGHYLGDTFEVWFNIYQADYDHDGIPYQVEVNVLHTNPMVDDSLNDPDSDGIPTSWEWRWGYDPHTWDDHEHLDPDIDGVENIEEYQLRKWFANPYQPDIYIETDGMQKRGPLDLPHVFFEESQQMIIERFAQHGINVYIDDGWMGNLPNGGGELLPFVKSFDDVVGGHVLSFYEHNFPDERKGIFRYVIIANEKGWCTSSKYNYYDTILVGTGIRPTFKTRLAFTERARRVCLAKGVLHELGHSMGFLPHTFPGIDIMKRSIIDRYPSMPDEEYEGYYNNYHSIMNYKYIWRDRKLFDFSDGSNGEYDRNDWDYIYLPAFQCDSLMYEEAIDENFEDFEVVDENPGVILPGWELAENLTYNYENMDTRIYIKVGDAEQPSDRNLRIYARPRLDPFPVNGGWSLIAEGYLNNNEIRFYS